MKITYDMSIKQIVSKYPQTSKVFVKWGLFCASCAVSDIENVKQGILGHGFSEEDFQKILDELNEYAQKPVEDNLKKFDITESALNKILEIKENNPDIKYKKFFRISKKDNEEENFEFTDDKMQDDILFYKNKLAIIIDKNSFENLMGVELNYKNFDFTSGFVFENID